MPTGGRDTILTIPDFIGRIEAYYGAEYSAGQLPYIKTYLAERTERSLDYLFAETLKSFSSQYAKCPDISIFDKLRGDIQVRLEHDQDLIRPAITADAGDEIDASETIDNLDSWLKERGRYDTI
jgi:hypothetical protein